MNDVLSDIINSLDNDSAVRDVRICLRATLVASKGLGVSYNFPLEARCEASSPSARIKNSGYLIAMPAIELAKYALSNSLLEASVGVAAINSIVSANIENASEENGTNIIMSIAKNKRVAMIGHFKFAHKLKSVAKNLDILELKPQTGDLPASKAKTVIPKADVVIFTGTTLVNHTFDELANMAKNSFNIMLGPTSIMSPILFDYGINAICGVTFTNEEAAIRHISEGGSVRSLKGAKQITMLSHATKRHQFSQI